MLGLAKHHPMIIVVCATDAAVHASIRLRLLYQEGDVALLLDHGPKTVWRYAHDSSSTEGVHNCIPGLAL